MASLTTSRGVIVGAACVAIGAAGGIVGSMAAPAKHHRTHTTNGTPPRFAGGHRPFGMEGGPPVHAEEVVLDKAGTAFITRTEDAGKVKSVSGGDVTITEGTDTVTYKDVTVTIPDGATVIRDGATAAVSDLKAGDFIHVAQSSDGTFVFAADTSWRPHPDGDGPGRFGRGGPGGPPPGPGGPPPGPDAQY